MSVDAEFIQRMAALVGQPSVDHVLGWDLRQDDEIDADLAVIASRLREALADSGMTQAEIHNGLTDGAARGLLVTDPDRTDLTSTITVAGIPRQVYLFRAPQ